MTVRTSYIKVRKSYPPGAETWFLLSIAFLAGLTAGMIAGGLVWLRGL